MKATFTISFFIISLWCNAQQPRLVLPIGHSDGVNSAAYSRDGKYIVTASGDKTAKLWNAKDGSLLLELKGHTENVTCASFSADGKLILTGSEDHSAIIWNVLDGSIIKRLEGNLSEVKSASFSPDQKRIVTSTNVNTAKIWDVEKGTVLVELFGHNNSVNNVVYSPDGKMILTASSDGTAKCWNAMDGRLVMDLKCEAGGIKTAVFSPDGKSILTAHQNYTAKVWNVSNGKLIATFEGHRSDLNSAAFSPDGKFIVTSYRDSTARVWEVKTGRFIKELKGHLEKVVSAVFSPDGKYILTSSWDNTAKIWNVTNATIVTELKGHSNWVRSAAYSPDEKYIATGTYSDNTVRIWNARNGNVEKVLSGHDGDIRALSFSPKGYLIVTASSNHTAQVWSTEDGWLFATLYGHTNMVTSACFSPDGNRVLTSSLDGTIKIWNPKTGELLKSIKVGYFVTYASYSPDGRQIVTASDGAILQTWDAVNGSVIGRINGFVKEINTVVYSPDGKLLLTSTENNTAQLWDAASGKKSRDLDVHSYGVTSAMFSADGKYIVTGSYDNTATICETATGKMIRRLAGHTNTITSAKFSPSGKYIATASADNTSKVWNFSSGTLRYTFFAFDSSDYLNIIPGSFYQGSSRAAKLLHYVTKDLKVISFEQLDVKYNRPDKVLEAIGNTDTALIKSYRKAWEKRIKKLGIDTTAFRDGFSVPEADFANRDEIEYEQMNGTLKLHIKGIDNTYQLDRFNIWVNETPLFEIRGINLKNKNTQKFDTTISVNLSDSINIIETSITNVNGTESYRMPLQVNYIPNKKAKEILHFIGIGIDKFKDDTHNLQWSVKDVRDLAGNLKRKYGNKIIIDTLFNESVTTANVTALKKRLQQTKENDKVIVAYSGHGLLSDSLDYYLSTYNVNFEKPEEGGLPYDALENLLDSIPARNKLMLIDACHSGEVDKEEMLKYTRQKKALNDSSTKGIIKFSRDPSKLGMKNSFELMQQLFVNVGRSTGATIISAAAGTQFALERGDLKNGVFTYSILEYMKDHSSATVTELKNYVNKRVPELTKGLQQPTSRTENKVVDWKVW